MLRSTLYALLLTLILAAAAHAAPPDAATLARYATWAQDERDAAVRIRDDDAGLAVDMFKYGGFVKDDLIRSKAAVEAEAGIHEKIAAAWDRAEPAAADRLRKELVEASRVRL